MYKRQTLDTPIISTDVGVANELISKYNCGTLIGYDEEEVAYVMEQYIESYEVAYKFNLGNDFDVETELSKTLEVIEDTINKKENKNKMKKLPYLKYQTYLSLIHIFYDIKYSIMERGYIV